MGNFLFFKHTKSADVAGYSKKEADFVKQRQQEGIGIKSSLMEYAAFKRNFNVNRLSKRIIIIESKGGNFGFHNMNGNYSSRVGMKLCDRKFDNRELLKNEGLNVVKSGIFYSSEYEKAIKFVLDIGFPVVVKPTNLSRGRGISTNIQSLEELSKAWEFGLRAYKKKKKNNQLIIEKHVSGEDYRFFVVGNKVVSITQRKRANIIGNGKSTVLELIKEKNKIRSKNPYLSNHLIPEDIELLDVLISDGYTLDSIPRNREEITLRSQSNLSAGGDSIDFTDKAHKGFNRIAIKAIKSTPGIEYGGVDIIATDITAKPKVSNHIVSEVEYSPAPIAHFPLIGKGRDMTGAILQYYLENKIK